jgi:hypothetical protein
MEMGGLVLDVFDDFNGATLREIWPSLEDVPAQVKEAHALSTDERAQLPDDVFALVLINGGEKQRKYACIDKGNTELSLQYFLKHAFKLPADAQKTAAENLKTACGWYGMEVPEPIEKIALGIGTAMTALTAIPIIKGTHQSIKENMGATKALEAQGAGIVTPQMRDAALGRKTAEASGTTLMPSQPSADKKVQPQLAVIPKTASVGHLIAHSAKDVPPSDNLNVEHKQQGQRLPQAGHLSPSVDVSNAAPPKLISEKKASLFALPSLGKYPLDSFQHVKRASAYFEENVRSMSPAMRHEFALNLVKRAGELDVGVSKLARKYGSEEFAPDFELKAAFDARRLELEGNEDALDLLEGVERITRQKMWKEANVLVPLPALSVVSILAEFDKVAGLNHYYDRGIPDPYYSILGFEKSAADEKEEWSEVIGNDMVTKEDLDRLVRVGAFSVKTTFGEDFQKEFLKDPVGIFQSMPLEQKKMLMRMANSTQPGSERSYY